MKAVSPGKQKWTHLGYRLSWHWVARDPHSPTQEPVYTGTETEPSSTVTLEIWWADATLVTSKGEGRGNHGERDSNERMTAGETKWPSGMRKRVAGCRVQGSQLSIIC